MRVLLSGGGTGGHIYPAISIGREIEKIVQGTELLFVGTNNGMESEIIPSEGIALRTICVRGFERRFLLKNIFVIFDLIKGLFDSWKIISDFKPELIIGTGGYVCGPVLLIGALRGIPTLIHEQNAIPGITNIILSKFVNKIAVTYKEAIPFFKANKKIFFSGNPVRPGFKIVEKVQAVKFLELTGEGPIVVVTGGSRGARSINLSMIKLARAAIEDKKIRIIHITGKIAYDETVNYYISKGISDFHGNQLRVIPYMKDMPEALGAADLVITRGGAGILSELQIVGCPSIVIPFPLATGNHQEMNARAFEMAGAGVMLLDKNLNEESIYNLALSLLENNELRLKMRKKSKESANINSANIIAKEAISITRQAVKI